MAVAPRKDAARKDAAKVGSVLVVGGGIAGMQSALDLANAGFLVHMVTEETSIGGKMTQLDKTFPTNECAMCLLGPRMTDTQSHPNIRLYTRASLEALDGQAGQFTARVKLHPRYVDAVDCTGCGECEAVCPVEVPNRFNMDMGNRKAIYKLFPQSVPNAYAIEKRGTPPCRATCPAGTNAQGYVALISQGKFKEALDVIRRNMPFPGICGRICHHPCEKECNRAQYDDPIAIATLKRAAADFGWSPDDPLPEPVPRQHEEKVAVIGAGPAGLTAALELATKGYAVTIFDSFDKPGGMLRYGIPRYRLAEQIVDREVQYILAHGIEFRGGVTVGKDVTLRDLRAMGYKAVVIAVGMQRSRSLRIEGAGLDGVIYGVDFLRDINLGRTPQVGERVLIIGGGNVAVDAARSALRLGRLESDGTVALDAARTALRLGAREVRMVCLESREEMPAHDWEVGEAEYEGIKIVHRFGPKRILGRDGRVAGVEMLKVTSVFDEDGRFNPKFIPESEESFEADTVIIAIGQTSDPEILGSFAGLETTRQGTIDVDPLTRATNLEGLFACGDVVNGPASVVDSVASAREAAISVDRYLRGRDLAEGRQKVKPEKLSPPENMPVVVSRRKEQKAELVKLGALGFREVLLGYDRETAIEEAKRCLNCGVCSECLQCEAACQKKAVRHQQEEETIELSVGAAILAPGFDLFDAHLKGEYGYGIYPNVLTSMQFERLLSSTGPTRGEVVRPSDGKHPEKIAFIQCVGSRDTRCGAPYCSSICCMYSTKEALIAREHDARIQPTIFHLDVRSYGKGFDRYVEAARRGSVRYVQSMISSVKEDPTSGNLRIRYYRGNDLVEEEFDLVVLAVGVQPPREAGRLAEAAGIKLNRDGFAWTAWSNPAASSRQGVFVAGAFHGPRDIPETVMSASAAAAAAGGLLAPARGTLVTPKIYPPERDVSGEDPRIGVFVCRCGINIASVVDVPAVAEYAGRLPGVAHAEEFLYTCSQDTLKKIKETIAEKELNRVVVASCTIRTHQPLFREALREAGLNQFLFEMANIRDQCSWVHRNEPAAATAKAKDLVRMAAFKVARHRPLHLHPVPVTQRALVIGGGIAGMTAALSFADQGFETYLVEKDGQLGGNLRRIHFTLDCDDIYSYLVDLVARVTQNPLIHAFLGARVEEFGGHAGHFVTVVGQSGGRKTTLEHGVILVATGGREYRPQEYFFGQDDRVVTGLEFEDLLSENDPWTLKARQIAMIQCVGSRDDQRRYCSRTCCAESIKNALLVKKRNPRAEVYILHRDIRAYGYLEHFYREARERGVRFIRFPADRPPAVGRTAPPDTALAVQVLDESTGCLLQLRPDLVVLAAATVAPEGTKELASLLKVPTNEDGFFLETHIKLAPMDFPSQGLFLCGGAHSPKLAAESIYQAQGAAARAATILGQENLMAGGVVAAVNPDKCAACLTCVRVCPYSVPRINADGVAEINAVQCHGCGSCAAECPGKAIQLQHYDDEQISAKIHGLFAEVV